jgi:SAM-dependent methyltransferase
MLEDYYEDYYNAELTHWWFSARRVIVASLLRKFAPTSHTLDVADIGCGMGANFRMLSEFGRVFGVDSSTTALGFSRQRSEGSLVAAGLPTLPFPNERFDVVCAFDVVEHVQDDRAACRELWRICRPGGLLIVTVPAYDWLWSEHDVVNEHKRRYTRRQLKDCLSQPGAQLLKLSYMNTVLAPPLILYRLLKSLLVGKKKDSGPARSDIFTLPPTVNSFLKKVFSSEAKWLLHGNFPFGVSVVSVAQKAK